MSSSPTRPSWWTSGPNGAGPCKQIGPSLEELSAEFGDRVKIVKLNVDENPNAASKFGVRGIPTLLVFKDGKVASSKVGAAPKSALQNWIESAL